MEHTVFFMYIHGIYVKKEKKEFEFFFGSREIRTHRPWIADSYPIFSTVKYAH